MKCFNCSNKIILEDTTYCNYNSRYAKKGEHTGDIYYCEECNQHYLDNYLNNKLETWNY